MGTVRTTRIRKDREDTTQQATGGSLGSRSSALLPPASIRQELRKLAGEESELPRRKTQLRSGLGILLGRLCQVAVLETAR